MKKGRLMVCPGEVELRVHPPVPTGGLTREEVLGFAERIRTTVRTGVDEPAPSP
jgi:hypothetical protein